MSVPSIAPVRGTVLVVEDDPQTARLIARLLTRDNFTVDVVIDGARALQTVASSSPDLVLLDWMLPGISGIDVCRQLKQDPATRLIPVVLVTGLDGRESRLEGINAGADDFLTKPFDSDELRARVRSLTRLKRYTDELDSAESVITSLALTVEARDVATDGHCHRLAQFATTLGEAAGEGPESLAALERGGYLHDVGKIGIPDAVLLKPGPLTPEETSVMRQHTVIGERLCGNLRSLAHVRPIVRHHHERLDGSGYPDGLRGGSIPLAAQIVGIVDTFDAVTSDRPYRPARALERACDELVADQRNGLFDAELVTLFLKLIENGLIRVPDNVS
ncbi:MAG TPA: HD domain-containing phosphohydrolase [Gemmatimonadaceae bacterium]|nr:HD domain-containing phosphohydrolase [Gemmatimonadaceae bacterium]